MTQVIIGAVIWVCTARNLAGRPYRAEDADENTSRRLALEKCEAENFRCYPGSCKEEIHVFDKGFSKDEMMDAD